MSTTPTSFEDIEGSLNQIGHHLLNVSMPLLPAQKPSTELAYLERLNGILKHYHQQLFQKSRALYQSLEHSDLTTPEGQAQLTTLKARLNPQLQHLDDYEQVDGKARKSFMTFESGFTALTNEATLGAQDRLLHPQEHAILERVPQGLALRPGLYALTFNYQDHTLQLAGAFVLTEKSSPLVTSLASTQATGAVMLFTPTRGIETFDSLAELNTHLLQNMQSAPEHDAFMNLLPARYRALSSGAIWPLELSPIDDRPLFEHTYNAMINKRTHDIDQALSLADNPDQDASQLISALDRAIQAALPDLTSRLQWRAHLLLERNLRNSAPDWYRSANEARRATLAEHLGQYNKARQDLMNLLGPAATPETLARYQWLEQLSDDLDIHDLAPEHLHISTRRYVSPIGEYPHDRNLIELALRGLHTDDEKAGSDFLQKTTLTYKGAPLPQAYKDLTATWLAQSLSTLQPRIDFANAQQQMHEKPAFRQAIERMLDQRINALAYTAMLQGHLSSDDFQLVQDVRQGSHTQLSAATLSLHEAQLQDLWVLRQRDANGKVNRVLLCTPEAPVEQQFYAFDSEVACQNHVLGWTLDNGTRPAPGTLTDYLTQRVALRFRRAMKQVLNGLSFKPLAQEFQEVAFGNIGSHADCLKAMSAHLLSTRDDDYAFSTPGWYRSTSAETREKLATLADDAEGALRAYNEFPLSDTQLPSFNHYLHEQAKKTLNELLGRPRKDVDPDTVWAYSPAALIGTSTPPPLTYTELYRDGYADSVGFLDEKFSRSARFKGPKGVDLSPLTAEKVARSVTGVWIGQRYINEVRARLLNTGRADYDLRRNTTLSITQRQMHNAALECRLQGHIADVDWQWLERSIASMGDHSVQTRGTYAIHRLLLDGEWVIDNYLFSHAGFPTLLYTPNAPDGISFREAKLFNYLLKKTPGMIGYFAPRVAVQSQGRIRAFLETAKKQLPEHLDKTSASPARYDSTRAQPPVLDLRKALYDMKIQRKIDDIEGTTVNRGQMIAGILWTCVEWVTAIATAPFPVLSLSLGMLLAFKDGMLALHAYHQGDTAAALEHLIGYALNSAGAVLTDLRPALSSIKQLARLPARRTVSSAPKHKAMHLIQQLEPTPPAPVGMQAVLFNGEVLWAHKTPDVLGRYLLYRLDPVSGKLISTTRLAAPDAEGFWARTGVTGGAPKYEKVPEAPQPLKDHEMPVKYWRKLEQVLDPGLQARLKLQGEWVYDASHAALNSAAADLRSVQAVYQQQVERLTKDAQSFFIFMDPLPALADLPAIEASTPFKQLIANDTFAGNKNLVIGAVPDSIASKQLLIEHMDTLIEKGFKRLYVEYLPGDVFRPKLEKLNGGKTWQHIEQHLKTVDKAHGFAEDAQYSYLALVRKAREKGLKIHALDASTSYQLEDALQMGNTPPTTPRDNVIRNFYSHKAIAVDTAGEPDARWIALVAPSRMRTFEQIPGLADLQNAVALRVEDVAANQPVGIWTDTPGSILGDDLAKGDYKLTLQTSYKKVEPVSASAPAPSAAIAHYSEYDIAPPFRESITTHLYTRRGLDSRYSFSPSHQEAFNSFLDTRTRLDNDAKGYFANHVLPARPDPLVMTTQTTQRAFIEKLSKSDFSGLVVGESHQAQSSKAFLIEHMQELKRLKFETLYIEHLFTDLHQADLDLFYRTQRLSPNLGTYLKNLDRGQMPLYNGHNTYTEVIQTAAKHGIRIRALDCTASYHVKGLTDNTQSRNRMFSYFASEVIKADQAAQGPHKWIAFIGSAHTNTNLGVPGMVELQGAVSLQVRDTAPALARNIHSGDWETVGGSLDPYLRALRSDFVLDVGIEGVHAPAPFVPVDRARLSHPGYFLLESRSPTETVLLHHSSKDGIVETPIRVDENGMFYIDRWAEIKDQRFPYQFTLLGALRAEVGLRPAP